MNKINQSDIFNIDIDTIDKISLFEIYAEDEASRKHPVFYLLSTEEYFGDIFDPYTIIRIKNITNFHSNKYFYNKLFGRSINKIVQIFKKDNL